MSRPTSPDDLHDHDRGLSFDISTLMNRRRSLALLGGAGLATLTACVSGNADTAGSSEATTTAADATTTAATATTASDGTCAVIPEETAGPYPGDGSNGVNVLGESGIVRSDITSSFGSSTTVAEGVPFTIELTVVDTANSCAPLAGAAVYLWHCDINGKYSMYSQGVTGENYLRGVQETDASGTVTFSTIFPAAYDGRWPHVHFEVYPSVESAMSASDKLRTSQLALPEETASAVYATIGYEQSVSNLSRTSLESDNVFSDGYSLQLAKITGSVDDGLTGTLTVPV